MASAGFSITVDRARAPVSHLYVMALLNSSLLFWQLRQISNKFRGGWVTCTKQYVQTLPIHLLDLRRKEDRGKHERAIGLVSKLLELSRALPASAIPHQRTSVERQISFADQQLDDLVFELYGLSDSEIELVRHDLSAVVEGNRRPPPA